MKKTRGYSTKTKLISNTPLKKRVSKTASSAQEAKNKVRLYSMACKRQLTIGQEGPDLWELAVANMHTPCKTSAEVFEKFYKIARQELNARYWPNKASALRQSLGDEANQATSIIPHLIEDGFASNDYGLAICCSALLTCPDPAGQSLSDTLWDPFIETLKSATPKEKKTFLVHLSYVEKHIFGDNKLSHSFINKLKELRLVDDWRYWMMSASVRYPVADLIPIEQRSDEEVITLIEACIDHALEHEKPKDDQLPSLEGLMDKLHDPDLFKKLGPLKLFETLAAKSDNLKPIFAKYFKAYTDQEPLASKEIQAYFEGKRSHCKTKEDIYRWTSELLQNYQKLGNNETCATLLTASILGKNPLFIYLNQPEQGYCSPDKLQFLDNTDLCNAIAKQDPEFGDSLVAGILSSKAETHRLHSLAIQRVMTYSPDHLSRILPKSAEILGQGILIPGLRQHLSQNSDLSRQFATELATQMYNKKFKLPVVLMEWFPNSETDGSIQIFFDTYIQLVESNLKTQEVRLSDDDHVPVLIDTLNKLNKHLNNIKSARPLTLNEEKLAEDFYRTADRLLELDKDSKKILLLNSYLNNLSNRIIQTIKTISDEDIDAIKASQTTLNTFIPSIGIRLFRWVKSKLGRSKSKLQDEMPDSEIKAPRTGAEAEQSARSGLAKNPTQIARSAVAKPANQPSAASSPVNLRKRFLDDDKAHADYLELLDFLEGREPESALTHEPVDQPQTAQVKAAKPRSETGKIANPAIDIPDAASHTLVSEFDEREQEKSERERKAGRQPRKGKLLMAAN